MFLSRQNWEMYPLWQPFSLANFEPWCSFDHHQVSAHQQEHKAEGALKRPFLSSLVPLFQNESNCETFHLKMSPACRFIQFHANQSHFHKNGFALRLALKQRHKGTRKWPNSSITPPYRSLSVCVTSGIYISQQTMWRRCKYAAQKNNGFV